MPPLGRVRRSKRTQWRNLTNKLLSNDLSPTRLVSLPYDLLQPLYGADSCPTRGPLQRQLLTKEWSNGLVEGFVTKLEFLKRQGYGSSNRS